MNAMISGRRMGLYGVIVTVLDAVLGVLTRRTHQGLDRIPRSGPVVVASNHLSVTDPVVLACALRRVGRRASFLTMAEVFDWRWVGWAARRTGQIPVHRGTAGAALALGPAQETLAAGGLVALYPEGKITTDPDYRPLPVGRPGAVRLALAAGCPIVPVAQWGPHQLLSRDKRSTLTRPVRAFGWFRSGRLPRRPEITVAVGSPITVEELAAAGDHRAAIALVMDRIRDLQAGLVAAGRAA